MTPFDMTKQETCPHCGTSWVAGQIPQESIDKGFYDGPGFFSRVYGIEWLGEDRICEWVCPDCSARFPRGWEPGMEYSTDPRGDRVWDPTLSPLS